MSDKHSAHSFSHNFLFIYFFQIHRYVSNLVIVISLHLILSYNLSSTKGTVFFYSHPVPLFIKTKIPVHTFIYNFSKNSHLVRRLQTNFMYINRISTFQRAKSIHLVAMGKNNQSAQKQKYILQFLTRTSIVYLIILLQL